MAPLPPPGSVTVHIKNVHLNLDQRSHILKYTYRYLVCHSATDVRLTQLQERIEDLEEGGGVGTLLQKYQKKIIRETILKTLKMHKLHLLWLKFW